MMILRLMVMTPLLLAVASWLVPLPLPIAAKLLLAAALLVFSQFHLLSRLSSGSVFAPEFPRPLVILCNWGFGLIPLLALGQIGLLVVAGAASLLHGGWWAIPVGARWAVGAAAASLSAIGVRNAVRVPPVRDVAVAIAGLAPAFDGYRLLHLTDLHLSRLFPARWAAAVVARANAAGADLIVVTGDFIDGSVAMRARDVLPLRDLQAPDGVLAIPGNHEYFFDYAHWMRHLAGLGLHMLPNAHAVLSREQAQLVVAGVSDRSARRHGQPGPDLDVALAGAPADAPVILLDHQPGDARRSAARGVALQLSGHTHGGMVVGLDRLVARGNDGFVSGRYQVGSMTLIVGNGTGIWPGFALRLGRPSDMIRITLRRSGPA